MLHCTYKEAVAATILIAQLLMHSSDLVKRDQSQIFAIKRRE